MGVYYCTHLTAGETEAQKLTCLESIQAASDQAGIGIQTSLIPESKFLTIKLSPLQQEEEYQAQPNMDTDSI